MELQDMPGAGTEREILLSCLHNQRAIMFWKLEGLTADQAWQRHVESPTTLMGLIKHLTLVEQGWIINGFLGEEFDHHYDFDADRDAEFRHDPNDTVESVLDEYRAAIDRVDAVIAGASLDDVAKKTFRNGEPYTMRWIIVHLIEEIARHAGHADILRELTDAETGYLPKP